MSAELPLHGEIPLPLYLAEFQFRFNNRREAGIFGKASAQRRRALQQSADDASEPKQLELPFP